MIRINEGEGDRAARIAVGIVLLALTWPGPADGWVKGVGLVVGAMLLVTGAVGWCALYALLGISTAPRGPRAAHHDEHPHPVG